MGIEGRRDMPERRVAAPEAVSQQAERGAAGPGTEPDIKPVARVTVEVFNSATVDDEQTQVQGAEAKKISKPTPPIIVELYDADRVLLARGTVRRTQVPGNEAKNPSELRVTWDTTGVEPGHYAVSVTL